MNTENNIESPECRVVVSSTAIVRRLLELPPETEIQQPDGMWRRLTDNEYESANHTDTIYGDGMPFWVQGWRDLHHRLRVPQGSDSKRIDWLAQRCYLPGDHPDTDILVVVSEKWSPLGSFSCNEENDNKALRAAIDKMMAFEKRKDA